MVVKLLEAEDLALLEERINMFIVDKDNEYIEKHKNDAGGFYKLKFVVDIEVVPGYMVDIGGARNIVHDTYFIAVIQY